MLRTGLEWFRLLIVCLIAIPAWQVSRGAEKSLPAPMAKWHLSPAMLNADGGDRFLEQEDYGTNDPPDGYDSPADCPQNVMQPFAPLQPDHIELFVSCRSVPPAEDLKPALLRGRRT